MALAVGGGGGDGIYNIQKYTVQQRSLSVHNNRKLPMPRTWCFTESDVVIQQDSNQINHSVGSAVWRHYSYSTRSASISSLVTIDPAPCALLLIQLPRPCCILHINSDYYTIQ